MPTEFSVAPGGVLVGRTRVPGDKSVSHRAVILAALAQGTSVIDGFLEAEDCLATLAALRSLGVEWRREAPGHYRIEGRGAAGLGSPAQALDFGNSGTGMRLLCGALAGMPVTATLIGDASLSARPMERVAVPLRAMGAEVATRAGTPPLLVRGRRPLCGLEWTPEVPSAQVKSAILLAGLAAKGRVAIHETVPTRDHTERLLLEFGAECARDGAWVVLGPQRALRATRIVVPGDLSSAAFLIVGAAMTPGSDLTLEGVGLNPTRAGVLDALRMMGADLEVTLDAAGGVEPTGNVRVRGRQLVAADLAGPLVANAIDEIPMLMVAAATARGRTRLADAAELKRKESDRLATTAAGLAVLGLRVERTADGMVVQGGALHGGTVDADGDHRIAMAFAMAALRADGPVRVQRAAGIATSFPEFLPTVRALGLRTDAEAAA